LDVSAIKDTFVERRQGPVELAIGVPDHALQPFTNGDRNRGGRKAGKEDLQADEDCTV
jgi:hypothetical protein